MNIVLVHPVHGAKVAINRDEMEADLANGWTEYVAETSAPSAPKPVEAPVKRKYTRRTNNLTVEQPNEIPEFMISASDESEGD